MRKQILTFGEIMLRILPIDKGNTLMDTNFFRIEPGGSEANVAIALAHLGNQTALLTALPENNPLTLKIEGYLRYHGVDDSLILKKPGRIGLYWTENGIGPRNSFVQYDRESSAFSNLKLSPSDISNINRVSSWFHVSGISPAVSKQASKTVENLLNSLNNVPVSIDLNFRHKLWKWTGSSIHKYMKNICKNAILITANEADIKDSLGYGWDIKCGCEIAKNIFNEFKKLKYLSVSHRTSISASENKWTGFFYVRESNNINEYKGLSYHLTSIVDRIGSGDAFTAGIIHGIIHRLSSQDVINIAVALGALKHTIIGDACNFNIAEVMRVIETIGSGKIIR